jgi:chromosome segregation ATPase
MTVAAENPTAEIDDELARTWNRVGLLLGARFVLLDVRLDGIQGQLNRLEVATARGFHRVEARLEQLGSIEAKLERLGTIEAHVKRIDTLEAEVRAQGVRLDKVESRLDKVEQRLDKVEQRLDKVEQRLDRVEAQLVEVKDQLTVMQGQLAVVHGQLAQLIDLVTRNRSGA